MYVAPERFSSRRFLDAIGAVGVARLAVDEAHCLSEWGHDFRPDYLRLADVRERLGSPPTIALTATATERVSKDIIRALRLNDPVSIRTGFDRPNLAFAVVPVAGDHAKPEVLLQLLGAPDALPGGDLLRPQAHVHRGCRRARRRGHQRRRLPRGPLGRSPHRDAERLPGRRPRRGRGDDGLRHGHRQGGRPLGGALVAAGLAGGVLPAGRSRRARRRAGPVHAALQPARQGPDRVLHQPGQAERWRPPGCPREPGNGRERRRAVPDRRGRRALRGAAGGGGGARAGRRAGALPRTGGHVLGPAGRRPARAAISPRRWWPGSGSSGSAGTG